MRDETAVSAGQGHADATLRAAISGFDGGVWEWDVPSDRLTWPARIYAILGLDPARESPFSDKFFERLHPLDRARLVAEQARRADQRAPHRIIYRLRHADGRWLWFDSRGQQEFDADGRVTRVVGMMRDVTAEIETQQALQASERRFADLAATIPGLVYRYLIHADGRHAIDYASPHCATVWEIDPEDLIRDIRVLVRRVHPEDIQMIARSISASAQSLSEWRARYRMIMPDGRLKIIEGRGAPQRLPDGGAVWNSVAFDITDRAEAEAAAACALREAQAANAAKSQFLATISHEIRTPMNGVGGMAALLERTALTDRQRQMLTVLKESNAALLQIVENVLDFSRMDADQDQTHISAFDLGQLAQEVITQAAGRIDPAQVTLSLTVAPEAEAVARVFVGDRARIRRILDIVLDNAVKLTEAGTIALRLRHPTLNAVSITVADTGPGIPQDKLALIFEPFTQIDQSATRRHGGSGLGLSIARRIARTIGGDLTAASRGAGCGAEFTLTAPLAGQPRTEIAGG